MKKIILTLAILLCFASTTFAYTLKDCYKKYTWQGNPNETYYWFQTPTPAQLTFTFNQSATAPVDDIYEQVYDLNVLSPTNVDWAVFEPYELYTETNFVETVYTQPNHAYGAYADVSDNNVNPAYFYTYYPSLSNVTWSSDGNTAFFRYDSVYGYPSDLFLTVTLTNLNNFNFGTPLPTTPIALGFMSLISIPFFRKKV